MTLHAAPSHRSINVCVTLFPTLKSPTAQQSVAEEHVTFRSRLPDPSRLFGELTISHATPFQRCTNVSSPPVSALTLEPTAQQSEPETQATPRSVFCSVALVFGEWTSAQDVPFQRWISVCSVEPLLNPPIAQQSFALEQAMPTR